LTGLHRLAAGNIDAVVLDLSLPESQGLNTLLRIDAQTFGVPIVILTAPHDEGLAVQALQNGAQDYLVKGEVTGKLLLRSLRYAIECRQLRAALHEMSVDDLTGLYNYRSFRLLAEQHLQLACRSKSSLLFLFADLDNLKIINDEFGHLTGNQALVRAATVLRRSFRASDILARVGGDEFAALAVSASGNDAGVLAERFREEVETSNREARTPWPFSLSAGVACFEPTRPSSLEELMSRADQAMYAEKVAHKNPGGRTTPVSRMRRAPVATATLSGAITRLRGQEGAPS
jgi:diguanylate cyclase (GGDEF)-like protein